MWDDLDNLFDMLDEPTNPLARLAWLQGLPSQYNEVRYQLFDEDDVPFKCCHCGQNLWRSTGDEFVCDHSHDAEYEYCPLPVYDAVAYENVLTIVQVE